MKARAGWSRVARMSGQAVLTLASIVVLVFLLVRLIPGDPVKVILGVEYTPEKAAALRAQLNLDKSIPEQFVAYIGGLLRGDLGQSTAQRGRSVTDVIAGALPTTMSLVIAGILLGVIVGTTLGLLAAISTRRGVDVTVRTWGMLSFSVPTFLVALLLIFVFALSLRILPAGGWPNAWPDNLLYLILPAIALSVHLATAISRTVRQGAIDTMGQQHMEAAFARGLPPRLLNLRHVLPNSVLPVLTIVGISFGTLLTGAIIVEAVFGIPGLGAEMTRAVGRRDYPVVQGIALVTGVVVVLSSFVVESLYTFVDPRARTL
ncbi:ABC transporter permease [Naasia aerilata]|uniref:Peptide ABC transporter permease n=1 Tax=Naasia aerilata TaxID=1162966 RepID=A0ABM8GD21_9MICO|nr:ABC transporter permease [Naasia aerilata]BDZ46173.1 peptide ABC transporter permease [Naasia aerilata]